MFCCCFLFVCFFRTFTCIDVVTLLYICCICDNIRRKMTRPGELLLLCTLRLLLHRTAADASDNVHYFTSSKKPLECHEIISISARSALECSLQCLNNLYSCAGYVFGRKENLTFQCDACFIYDVSTPLVIVQASNNLIIRMPRVNLGSGKMPF